MLAGCQQAPLKPCHCELKGRKSHCQWHAIHLGIYNKNRDAVIKGTESVPSIYIVNKRNIKMFHSVPNPTLQDGLEISRVFRVECSRKRPMVILWQWFTSDSSAARGLLLHCNREIGIYIVLVKGSGKARSWRIVCSWEAPFRWLQDSDLYAISQHVGHHHLIYGH